MNLPSYAAIDVGKMRRTGIPISAAYATVIAVPPGCPSYAVNNKPALSTRYRLRRKILFER